MTGLESGRYGDRTVSCTERSGGREVRSRWWYNIPPPTYLPEASSGGVPEQMSFEAVRVTKGLSKIAHVLRLVTSYIINHSAAAGLCQQLAPTRDCSCNTERLVTNTRERSGLAKKNICHWCIVTPKRNSSPRNGPTPLRLAPTLELDNDLIAAPFDLWLGLAAAGTYFTLVTIHKSQQALSLGKCHQSPCAACVQTSIHASDFQCVPGFQLTLDQLLSHGSSPR